MYGMGKLTNSAEVFLKDLATGALSFYGCTTDTSINKTLESSDIRCGIDAGLAGLTYTNPDMTVTVATGAWNDYMIQLQNDEDWKTAQTLNVPRHSDTVTLVTATANGTYTFAPAIVPVTDSLVFQDTQGKSYPTVFATPMATVTGGAGLRGKFSWLESVSTASTFDFKVSSLPKSVGLVLHHVVYDVSTNEPLADVYFEFDKVVGDGNLDLAMTLNNTAVTSVTLRALPDTGKFMRQIYVPRA
jgi:hypothetical protein